MIYATGYARAVMHRANRDYKGLRAAVPPARKAAWRARWKVVQVGFLVLLGFAMLVTWAVVNDR